MFSATIATAQTTTSAEPDRSIRGHWRVTWHDWPEKGARTEGEILIFRPGETRSCPKGVCRYSGTADAPWKVSTRIWGHAEKYTEDNPLINNTGWTAKRVSGPVIEFGVNGGPPTTLRLGSGGRTMSGRWEKGKESGSVAAARRSGQVVEVIGQSDILHDVAAGEPVHIRKRYDLRTFGAGNNMRGNRPGFEIEVLGLDIPYWARPWIDPASGLEIVKATRNDGGNGRAHGRNIRGWDLKFVIWAHAKPGRHTAYLEDLAIPIDLTIDDAPGSFVDLVLSGVPVGEKAKERYLMVRNKGSKTATKLSLTVRDGAAGRDRAAQFCALHGAAGCVPCPTIETGNGKSVFACDASLAPGAAGELRLSEPNEPQTAVTPPSGAEASDSVCDDLEVRVASREPDRNAADNRATLASPSRGGLDKGRLRFVVFEDDAGGFADPKPVTVFYPGQTVVLELVPDGTVCGLPDKDVYPLPAGLAHLDAKFGPPLIDLDGAGKLHESGKIGLWLIGKSGVRRSYEFSLDPSINDSEYSLVPGDTITASRPNAPNVKAGQITLGAYPDEAELRMVALDAFERRGQMLQLKPDGAFQIELVFSPEKGPIPDAQTLHASLQAKGVPNRRPETSRVPLRRVGGGVFRSAPMNSWSREVPHWVRRDNGSFLSGVVLTAGSPYTPETDPALHQLRVAETNDALEVFATGVLADSASAKEHSKTRLSLGTHAVFHVQGWLPKADIPESVALTIGRAANTFEATATTVSDSGTRRKGGLFFFRAVTAPIDLSPGTRFPDLKPGDRIRAEAPKLDVRSPWITIGDFDVDVAGLSFVPEAAWIDAAVDSLVRGERYRVVARLGNRATSLPPSIAARVDVLGTDISKPLVLKKHGTAAYLSEPFAIGEETFGAALAGAEAMRARVRAGDVWEETTAKIVATSLRVAAMHFAVDGEATRDLPIGAAVQVEITYQTPPGADHARSVRVKVTTPRHPSGLTRNPAVLLKIERVGNDPKRFRSQPFTLVGPGKSGQGKTLDVVAGYRLTARHRDDSATASVTLAAPEAGEATLTLRLTDIDGHAMAAPVQAKPADGGKAVAFETNGPVALPAGSYELTTDLTPVGRVDRVTLDAGETREIDLSEGLGRLVLRARALEANGPPPRADRLSFHRRSGGSAGWRDFGSASGVRRLDVPAGTYDVTVTLAGIKRTVEGVRIDTGNTTELPIGGTLGRLAVTLETVDGKALTKPFKVYSPGATESPRGQTSGPAILTRSGTLFIQHDIPIKIENVEVPAGGTKRETVKLGRLIVTNHAPKAQALRDTGAVVGDAALVFSTVHRQGDPDYRKEEAHGPGTEQYEVPAGHYTVRFPLVGEQQAVIVKAGETKRVEQKQRLAKITVSAAGVNSDARPRFLLKQGRRVVRSANGTPGQATVFDVPAGSYQLVAEDLVAFPVALPVTVGAGGRETVRLRDALGTLVLSRPGKVEYFDWAGIQICRTDECRYKPVPYTSAARRTQHIKLPPGSYRLRGPARDDGTRWQHPVRIAKGGATPARVGR